MQVDDHWMPTSPLGHRHVRAKAGAELDIFFQSANGGKVLVVNDRQFFPSTALRGYIACRIPARQSPQNLTVVFADHGSYLPVSARAF
jgi:hypothetical protein